MRARFKKIHPQLLFLRNHFKNSTKEARLLRNDIPSLKSRCHNEGGIGIFGFAALDIFLIGFSVFVSKIFGFSVLVFNAVFGFFVFQHLVFGFRKKY